MKKLIVLPSSPNALGGTLISLSLLIQSFENTHRQEQLQVLVLKRSLMEEYLTSLGLSRYLKLIEATETTFLQKSLAWLKTQPREYPLIMENCVQRKLFLPLILTAPRLRLSRRPIYFFFRDLAISYNPMGYILRKLIFTLLDPNAICNSNFTASYIRRYTSKIRGILYPPIDTSKFHKFVNKDSPPDSLKPILETGLPLMLTPCRLNKPGIVNDKNLRILPKILASLKARGLHYYSVIIGQDTSSDKSHTRALLDQARALGVADRFIILPPTFEVEKYYNYADIVVTLAPREPFGRTVVEAIACGVPVVASKTGGLGEILSNFAPQWTVDPFDPDTAAQKIQQVLTDSDSQKVVARGQGWIKANCTTEDYADKMLKTISGTS